MFKNCCFALTAVLLLVFSGCGSFSGRRSLQFSVSGRQATVRSARLEAVIEDGCFISCRELSSGRQFAAPGHDAGVIPIGLGCLSDNVEELRRLHVPWGEVTLNQHLTEQSFSLYLYPDEQSEFVAEAQGAAWILSWRNLTNGTKRFADCSLSLRLEQDASGALSYQSSGMAPQGGIFGIQVPLSNLNPELQLIFPHFGGMRFKHSSKEALCPFGSAPFWEAPVIAMEYDGSALGLWMEDSKFSPYYAFFKNGTSGFSFSYELNSLMPVEDKRQFVAPAVKLDIFPGDWQTAMAPFRRWYQKKFATELACRDSLAWAEQIKLVIDNGSNYEKVAATFPPETVMYHNWNGRAPKFDTELPDWTPREGYIEGVEKIHSYGFKAMAYVNTYCINYQSPVFIRDQLEQIFLTRKNSLWRYNSQAESKNAALSDMLIGTVDQGKKGDQFAGIAPGRLLYGDPLSTAWRQYHAESMRVWNTNTKTDANYEDTAGCVDDHGNGIIDGLSAGQGSVAQMQLLQQTQPGVPMASEYGPEGIAFAVKWPLNYAQVWGGHGFRHSRLHRQEPVTTYLYGYTTWIPIIRCGDDFTRHLVSACSDALGGMGMLSANFADPDTGGMSAHLTLRALLFTHKRLTPYFASTPNPEHIRCLYQGIDGIYQYYDDGKLQKMLGPDGQEEYGRIDNCREYRGQLQLPGWPLCNEERIFGLNPGLSYALFPAQKVKVPALQVKSLPEPVSLFRYYSQADFAYLELQGTSEDEIDLEFELLRSFPHVYLNDTELLTSGRLRSSRAALPLRLLAFGALPIIEFGSAIGSPESLVNNIGATGLYEGAASTLAALPNRRSLAGQPAYFVNYFQVKQMDWPLQVPADASAAVQILFKNFSNRYGNGSIVTVMVNGKSEFSFDCQQPNPEYDKEKKNSRVLWDNDLHELIVPLGQYAGRPVLISVAVDDKGDTNSDNQSVCIPVLIQDTEQKLQQRVLP
ncbi:MAG: DUF6259 domain-containing protein [Lentisphaeria bacterium]